MEDDAAEGERRREIGRRFVDAIPWTRALGMEMLELGEGRAVMRAPYDPRFVGDPTTGVIHGGVLTALLDTCSGAAVMSHPSGVTGTATIDLRIDYMRAARPGEAVTARAECHRAGGSVAFVRAVAFEDDPDDPVATATGAFTVERAKRRAGGAREDGAGGAREDGAGGARDDGAGGAREDGAEGDEA